MSSPKQLAEAALRVMTVVRELPIHEKAAVLGLVGTMLQAEAKSLELTETQTQRALLRADPASMVVGDEHYREQ
jgi:hypothetical protein